MEAFGAAVAVAMSLMLLQMGREERGGNVSRIAIAFLAMGILDAFHATSRPGHGFVLLHSTAVLAGGFWFASIWLPRGVSEVVNRRWFAWAVAGSAVGFGIYTPLFRETLPLMVQGGRFTTFALVMNSLGGVLFLAGVLRIATDSGYFNETGLSAFAFVGVLLGIAGITFGMSAIWDMTWWFWHLLRLSAFVVVLGFVFGRFQRVSLSLMSTVESLKLKEEELRRHRDHLEELVEERSAEIRKTNELLEEEITERTAAEEAIKKLNEDLAHHAAELEAANKELEAFAYSVSHDLRAPLRSIDGFSQVLTEDYSKKLDDQGRDYLSRVRAATQRMGQLIDDMLQLSRVTRAEMKHEEVSLSALAKSVAAELQQTDPDRDVDFVIASGLTATGDKQLLRVVLVNLLGNSWKFTSKHTTARIEFGAAEQDGNRAFFVRDDGAGFDPTYAGKLFTPFQRLHQTTEFPGTGVGLALVQRVVSRHGGRVWAEGAVEKGATFYFTL